YDATFGARPLKRIIQRELQDPLAVYILEGALREGEMIYVDVGTTEGGETALIFSQSEPVSA
ncbi:MAG TPA: hypothetical protein PLD47_11280, partial [Aggregatilineales bacterium]|nr:hypothetical protein [Aggregatilineales bacterium]